MTKKITLRADDGSADFQGQIQIPDPDALLPAPLDAVNRKWADRARVEVGLDAPTGTDLYVGRLWYDTAEGVTTLKMWDGVRWVVIDGPETPFGDGSLGVTMYVNGVTGSDIFVTDDFNSNAVPPITNQMVTAGYSQDSPFKTLARAAIEVARITTENPLFNPEFYDRIVIMVAPGDQVVENSPAVGTVEPWTDGYIPDAVELQKFCHSRGGIILSRGVSVQGEDLRKSIVRPNYVPPFGGNIYTDRAAIFRLTGGSYFFNFTFKDKLNYAETHNLLDCFAFTSDAELESFYTKVSIACSLDKIATPANPGETQIVAPQPPAATRPTDGVVGSSPYIFNCSVRSVFGLCGIHADGNQTTGFNSMVVAQFTGVSLQTDIRCWQYYDASLLPDNPWVNYTSANTYQQLIDANPNNVRQNPERLCSHVRTLNEAVIQEVSVFAIGQGVHHWAESGSEITVTNSNSNFGGVASLASGYKPKSFPIDSNWEVNRIRPSTDMSDQTNNIKEITIGRVIADQSNTATTIELEAGLQPGVLDPGTPLLLERDGYSLKEGDYIWIVNTRGPDWRAVLAANPWSKDEPNLIKVKTAFSNQDGNTPGGIKNPGPPETLWPSLSNSVMYIRRIVDTRTVGQRQNALLLLNTASSRTPIRDFVIQTNINGGRGIQGLIPDSTLSTISTSAAITDTVGSDVLIELRNNTGDTEWAPGALYRLGTTVRYQDKHFSCVVENSNVAFTPTDWSESFVHMPEEFNQEGYFKNAKPIITFNDDKSGIVESQTLGYNFGDPDAANYAWRDDISVRDQHRTAVDYKGLFNFLVGLGFSSDESHVILYPRNIADRDINPSDPTAATGTELPSPDGAANDWAKWGIEFRRPSNIRLFGHAFEWAGFGNYTKALPLYQQELAASNVFTYYFTNNLGGRVYASGFNEEGFVVTPRGLIDLQTGDEVGFEFIGGTSDSDAIELPTFYQELEIAELTCSSSLIFAGATVTGNPTWIYDEAYIPTDTTIGPFGDILPKLAKATEAQEGSLRIATQAEANALEDENLALTPANVPIGSPGQPGLVSFATQAEANALFLDDVAIAPATIPISSTDQQGLIDIATQPEANALTDATKAITPGNLPRSTTTQIGAVELATVEETAEGTRNDVAVTPFSLQGAGVVPQGGIIMWSGTIAEIADLDDWALCDGSTVDGVVTPDLRDRFIYGAGGSRQPNTFGAATATGIVSGHSLSRSEVPTHVHAQLGSEATASLQGGTNGATLSNIVTETAPSWTGGGGACTSPGGANCAPGDQNDLGGEAHSHGLTITSNEPDWYALAFILRLR